MDKKQIEKALGRKMSKMENKLYDIHFTLVDTGEDWDIIFEHGTFSFKKR